MSILTRPPAPTGPERAVPRRPSRPCRGAGLLWGSLLLLSAQTLRAEEAVPFDLLTAAEVRQESEAQTAAPAPSRSLRGRPAVAAPLPAIQIVSPQGRESAVVAPLRLQATFTPAPGARIVPQTFRILYGLLKIDLTDRVARHARISEAGVVIDAARVPVGQHRFILQVSDDQHRMAEQELRVQVSAVH